MQPSPSNQPIFTHLQAFDRQYGDRVSVMSGYITVLVLLFARLPVGRVSKRALALVFQSGRKPCRQERPDSD